MTDEMAEEMGTSSSWTPVFPELVPGMVDGSCPAGSHRISPANCPNVAGWNVQWQYNGADLDLTLSNRRHRTDCRSHFTTGEGCFFNNIGDVYSTRANCAVAGGGANKWAVCEQDLVRGDLDGSCPTGTFRLSSESCRRTSGHTLSDPEHREYLGEDTDGLLLTDRAHRVSCASHFVSGAGCFANAHGNVYSTAAECSTAVNLLNSVPHSNPGHFPVCTGGRLVRGGTDGSCPAGATRVTAQDCPGVNGQSMTDGTALSTGAFRVDCAAHFTPGEGCFVNDRGNVYATEPGCASAEARGGIAIHHAVCWATLTSAP